MITYLDGQQQVAFGEESLNVRIENKNYTTQERQKVLDAAKDYYSGLNMKWWWHSCYHEDKKSCTRQEAI